MCASSYVATSGYYLISIVVVPIMYTHFVLLTSSEIVMPHMDAAVRLRLTTAKYERVFGSYAVSVGLNVGVVSE